MGNPRKTRWTKSFRKLNHKELTDDGTYLFEVRRNIPIKYNREDMSKILDSMDEISAIRKRREDQFIKNRMKINKKLKLNSAKRTIRKHYNVLISSAAAFKEKTKDYEEPELSTSEDDEEIEQVKQVEKMEADEEPPRLKNKKKSKSKKVTDNEEWKNRKM